MNLPLPWVRSATILATLCVSVLQAEETVDQLKAKAAAGDRHAHERLATIYFQGDGVEKDHAQALRWATKPAEQDDVMCAGMIAQIHYQGRGVKRDLPAALAWFKRAAALGDANAAFTAGLMNDEGHGVPRNPVEALAWYRLSLKLGEQMEGSVKYANALEQKLTPKQVGEAQSRFVELLGQVERKKDELYEKRLAAMKAANPTISYEELRKQVPR